MAAGPDDLHSRPAASTPESPTHVASSMNRVEQSLRRLRTTARVQLVVQRLALLGAWTAAIVVALAVLDYLLRLPEAVRLTMWAIGVAVLAVAAWRRLLPALRFTPSLTSLALRVEQTPEGKAAGLPGVLASALELGERADAGEASAVLARRAREEAASRFSRLQGSLRVLEPGVLRRAAALLALAGLPIVLAGLLAPAYARIGSARVLTPWAAVAWPKRTEVVDVGAAAAHPIGVALPLKAALVRSAREAAATDVRVRYRLIVDGTGGEPRTALLTHQGRRVQHDPGLGAQMREGELFERLIDAASLLPPGVDPAVAQIELEYAFETADDATPAWRVLLVQPPSVESAQVLVEPPGYAVAALAGSAFVSGVREAGAGLDASSAIGPVLAHSRVTLTLRLNKRIPALDADPLAFTRAAAPVLNDAPGLSASAAGLVWTVTFNADQTRRVALDLRDQHGIASREEHAFRVDVVEDQPPTAAVVEPPSDESVLATAVISIVGEGRDDLALSWASLEGQKARKPADSAGAAAQPLGEPLALARVEGNSGVLPAAARLELQSLELQPGDELWLTARAADGFEYEGRRHEVAASSVRRLRIIGEAELFEEIRAELGGVRDGAKRADAEQARLETSISRAAGDAQAAEELARAQTAVGERAAGLQELAQRLSDRIARNNPDDKSMAELLEDVRDALEQAAGAADEASAQSRALAGADDASRDAREQAARAAQQAVREPLAEVVEMLDQGQDGWLVRRAVEQLLNDQRQIAAQSQAAAAQTRGRALSELSREERAELERLAQRQDDLAQRTNQTLDQLEERARQLEQVDQGQSAAMRAAAQQGRNAQVSQQQRQAGEQLRQNQSGAAQRSQQQAQRALEQMAQELDRAQQRRDEALRRTLGELAERLDALIARQEQELARLGAVLEGREAPAGLDVGVIDLNRATLAVLALAESARETQPLGEPISAAASSQGAAVAALRLATPDLAQADESQRSSLAALRRAKTMLEEMEAEAEERDQARQRAQLRQAYREALESQVAIQSETAPLEGRELSRRDRATARALGDRQEELRMTLENLRSSTQELQDAALFTYAHARLDEAMARAGEPLREGRVTAAVGRGQRISISTLRALVEALSNPPEQDELREDAGSGGGGDGGGGNGRPPLLPPIAELRLLRMMQSEAAERTRALDEAGPAADPAELEDVATLQDELATRARELLDKLQERGSRGGADSAPPQEGRPTP